MIHKMQLMIKKFYPSFASFPISNLYTVDSCYYVFFSPLMQVVYTKNNTYLMF